MNIEKINGEKYYKIENCHQMRPFFMSIVSDSNHWLFISSNGGLSAGRKNAENALFPYYTDDKITESFDTTGSKTIVRIHSENGDIIWEPFSDRFNEKYTLERNLYKSIYGNSVIFEEVLDDHQLVFRYKWASSDQYGFVRTAELINLSKENINLTVLDGIQNIMPYGVNSDLQNGTSNLVDAYKRNELNTSSGMGIYALSAIIVDRAEPSEALKCNIAWSIGLEDALHLVSSRQLNNFGYSRNVEIENDVKGERGAYFLIKKIELVAEKTAEWYIVADVNQTHSQVVKIIQEIEDKKVLSQKLLSDIQKGTENLKNLISAADGIQHTTDDRKNNRHYSNVLFNIMRGGIFDQNYTIEKPDFLAYLKKSNSDVFNKNTSFLDTLKETFTYQELVEKLQTQIDPDFIRLGIEYLPLKFSRRHGDPSRPWNRFSINTKNEDGSKVLDYEGNWRDIFQNWEVLAYSYPSFIVGMIFKFLNSTTFDGYNPYRVTKGGFDWEKIEVHNPWASIGYWGDHQIIYLLKFLEFIEKVNPGKLESYFDKDYFVYAAVPYRIKPYKDLIKNSRVTIDYDFEWEEKIDARRQHIGADGALVKDNSDGIYKVNLIEKLLATSLAKMSNFVPGGGIWMNTQRPEWNDANNALVGDGLSMVTLFNLRRFFKFFGSILENSKLDTIKFSNEIVDFYHGVREGLLAHKEMLHREITDQDRKIILDLLGTVASDYRSHIYFYGFWGKKRTHSVRGLKNYIQICLEFIDHSIALNQRTDNLYHSYNLMTYKSDGISVSHLSEMLEGQVAVLSSGYLTSCQQLQVLDALRFSALYRKDAQSYILYPNKNLPRFLEKNCIEASKLSSIKLIEILEADGNHAIMQKDLHGVYHFNGNFNNANSLIEALNKLDTKYQSQVTKDKEALLKLFEEVFNHKSFTGRSGTFYAYEGLGSIYWHMVSKLYLAIAESIENSDKNESRNELVEHFYHTGNGIGLYNTPQQYGAFPTDPYSHTPSHRGAQQPGMTGQVKEDIITRFKELGVKFDGGKIQFNPTYLKKTEFYPEQKSIEFITVDGQKQTIDMPKDSLAFSICQTPVIYKIHNENKIEIIYKDKSETIQGNELNAELTKQIFNRSGEIQSINVFINY
jgi:hypothetical protein